MCAYSSHVHPTRDIISTAAANVAEPPDFSQTNKHKAAQRTAIIMHVRRGPTLLTISAEIPSGWVRVFRTYAFIKYLASTGARNYISMFFMHAWVELQHMQS